MDRWFLFLWKSWSYGHMWESCSYGKKKSIYSTILHFVSIEFQSNIDKLMVNWAGIRRPKQHMDDNRNGTFLVQYLFSFYWLQCSTLLPLYPIEKACPHIGLQQGKEIGKLLFRIALWMLNFCFHFNASRTLDEERQ